MSVLCYSQWIEYPAMHCNHYVLICIVSDRERESLSRYFDGFVLIVRVTDTV